MSLRQLFRPYGSWVLLILLVSLVPALAQAFLGPWLVKPLFDQVLGKGDFSMLTSLLLRGLLLLVTVAVGLLTQEVLVGYLSALVPKVLRERIQLRLLTSAELSALVASPAALSGRVVADLAEIESFVLYGLGTLLSQGTTLLALVAMLFVFSWRLSLVLLVALPIMALIFAWLGRIVARISRSTQAAIEGMAGEMAEGLTRVELVRALGLSEYSVRRFAATSERLFKLGFRRAAVAATNLPLSQLAVAAIVGVLLFVGVRQVEQGFMSTGALVAYLTLMGIAIAPIQMLPRVWMILSRGEGAAGRLLELLSLPSSQPEGSLGGPVRGQLSFDQVRFTYPAGDEVLRGLNLDVNPGELVALVGLSGAGKSTILRLALGLYPPTGGRVLLDGRNLMEYRHKVRQAALAWVPQEPTFFAGPLEEVLAAMAPSAGAKEMQEMIAHVGLWPELTDGLQSYPGKLSVGQRQRLAIAAALLRGARVLFFDEMTSAQDPLAEGKILRAIETAREGRSVLVVAHRLSTVRHADRILVLEGGVIVEQGTHDELLARGGAYTRLASGFSA